MLYAGKHDLRVLLVIFLMASTEAYGDPPETQTLTSRFTCSIIRGLYAANKDHLTKDEMKDFLRSQGFSEPRIAEAEKCLK